MEQFASENKDVLKVVGVGTQDDLAFARTFYNRHSGPDSDVTLLWDASRESWRGLGVFAQPSWMLLDPYGEPLESFKLGPIDESAVLEKIA